VHGGQSLDQPVDGGQAPVRIRDLAKRDAEEEAGPACRRGLSHRPEMEVLKLVARGMNNRDIAKELFISENTVRTTSEHPGKLQITPGWKR